MFSFRTTPIADQMDKALREGKVACFCTANCYDTSSKRYMYELFRERGNLVHIFMPEPAEFAPDSEHIDFDLNVLKGLDAIVVEIQDAGVRYFNYTRDVLRLMSSMSELDMEECPSMYIVDHINPAGRVVEGTIPVLDPEAWTPRVAHRHGLTLGELAHLYYNEIGAKFALHIISAMASDASRVLVPWAICPSCGVTGMFGVEMQSGGGLWDYTTISPGIGTARPYEYIGAPFIVHSEADNLPCPEGVFMRPCSFVPSYGRYSGKVCNGYQILLGPGVEYHSLLHTIRLMKYFLEMYPEFRLEDGFFERLADPVIEEYLKGSVSFDVVQEHVKTEEQKWVKKARRFTLYDEDPYRFK